MAQNFISPSYTFTPGAAGVGTLNLSGISGFSIKRLIAVINVTRGVVIYSPVNPATSVASTTLTLGVDTSTHNAADNLIVKYESSQSDNLQVGGSDVSTSNPMPVQSSGGTYVEITPTLDTSAYVSGDTLFDKTQIANAIKVADGTGILNSVCVIDKDNQRQALDLVFLSSNVTFGTANSAPSISDGNAVYVLGKVSILVGDYVDLGSNAAATISAIGLGLKTTSGTRDVYVAAISRGTPTHTASGLLLRFHIDTV